MKKLGLAFAALLIAGGIYYFSAGSEKLATVMKTEINAEFASLKNQGFKVETKALSPKQEHFVLTFDEPAKIAAYLTDKGVNMSASDAEVLKGLTLGVDVSYLANAYASVSFDVYPMTLPLVLSQSAKTEEDKKVLAQANEMLTRKVFLLHADVNKLGTGFKGFMKDIDETLKVQKKDPLELTMKDFSFKGSIEDEKISQISQVLKHLSFIISKEMSIVLEEMTSDYKVSGTTNYDYESTYEVKNIQVSVPEAFNFEVKGLEASSNSDVQKELLKAAVTSKIKEVSFKDKTQDLTLKSLTYNMDAKQLPLAAIKKFETLDENDEEAILAAVQELLSQGLVLTISDLSVENLLLAGKEIKGFKLNSHMTIDKKFDFAQAAQNPMSALSSVDANLDLTLSEDLFALAAQAPQAMMLMMLIQPESVNGEKVYKAELKDGKVTVNGKPVM